MLSSKFGVVVILIPILNNLVYIGNASFPLQYDIESMSGSSEYMLSVFFDIIFFRVVNYNEIYFFEPLQGRGASQKGS